MMYENFDPYYPLAPYGIPVLSDPPEFPPINQQSPLIPESPSFISSPVLSYIPTAPRESMIQTKKLTENSSDQQKPQTLSNQSSTIPANPNIYMYYSDTFNDTFQSYR